MTTYWTIPARPEGETVAEYLEYLRSRKWPEPDQDDRDKLAAESKEI